MHVMIAILMSPSDPKDVQIDGHVKVFLSCVHRYCRTYYAKKEIPFWAKTGNFPTLLNLASQRKHHGPIRWYWEGTSERYIQQLKKHLVSMGKTTEYFMGTLTLMHKSVTMDWIKRNFVESEAKNKRDHRRMYYQYKSLDDITIKMRTGEVISGFMIKGSNKICVAYGKNRRGGKMNVIGIQRVNKGRGHKVLGLAYVKCLLDPENMAFRDQGIYDFIENYGVEHYCLLLPFIDEGNFEGNMAVVYDDWDVGDINFKKVLPTLCEILFGYNVLSKT